MWISEEQLRHCTSSVRHDGVGITNQFRLDHITFDNLKGLHVKPIGCIWGVLDNNTVTRARRHFLDVHHGNCYGDSVGWGDKSWTIAPSFGSTNALYLENHTHDATTSPVDGVPTDCKGGGRFVVRKSIITNSTISTHGTESGGRERGCRQVEVYNTTFQANQPIDATVGIRSGTALLIANTHVNLGGGGWGTFGNLALFRASTSFGGWGICDGTGPWDKNDGVVYASGTHNGANGSANVLIDTTQSWPADQWALYGAAYSVHNTTQGWGAEIATNTATTATSRSSIYGPYSWNAGDRYQILRAPYCLDQPGRGQSRDLSGVGNPPSGSTGDPLNALEPIYAVGNTDLSRWKTSGNFTVKIAAERDYYSENASFDGSAGTGFGTIASRPATCTTGVAYWVTNEGSWDTTNPANTSGRLYKCASTNTWTLFYTPYTYPHPLRTSGVLADDAVGSGVTAPANPPQAPTNLKVQ